MPATIKMDIEQVKGLISQLSIKEEVKKVRAARFK